MNKTAWRAFSAARDQYREAVEILRRDLPQLRALQQELINHRTGPAYTVDTPVVYNGALDDVGPGDDITLILVADNPGRREQAAENRRYLVGPSGKIAEKFFRDHPELGIDFRKNVIILNKTPIHTPRTAELRELYRLGDAAQSAAQKRRNGAAAKNSAFSKRAAESQELMARLLLEFHLALAPIPVWITGYSEMRRGGVFEAYTSALRDLYGPASPRSRPFRRSDPAARRAELFFYRHFSMNLFTIDMRRQAAAGETVQETLDRIGKVYRRRVLGW
jgi:hypothetical protein